MEPTHFDALYPANSRDEQINQVLGLIKQGKSAQAIGMASVGRSNLLGLLAFNKQVREKHLGENQKWFHFVLCNFTEIRKRPLADATKFLFLNLVDSLRERNLTQEYEATQKIFTESLSLQDELVLFQGLKRAIDFLAIEKELTIVFLFDRFEDYVPTVTSEFFGNLRVLRNRAKYRFSVVFSLSRPLEDLLEPQLFVDFYEFVANNHVYLPPLDKPGLEFRIAYLEKIAGQTIDKKTLAEIIELTGGHGKLTRLAVESLFTQNNNKENENLLKYLSDQTTIKNALYEIWQALSPAEQHALEQGDYQTITYLKNVGLVTETKMAIPLLDSYKNSLQQISQTPEHITYDVNTNEIKKGDQVVSEELTAGEFRLLRLLIQNPDRIVEREEIISSVWKDAASTAGVTDQALDQLIFRLRRKVEDDPNHPTHIHTIKGRGVRFTI